MTKRLKPERSIDVPNSMASRARSCPRKPSKGSNSAVVSKGRLAGSMRRRSTSTGSAPGADGGVELVIPHLCWTLLWRDAFFDAGIVNQRIGRGLLLTVNVESLLHSPIACWRSSGRPRRAGRRHQLLHRSKGTAKQPLKGKTAAAR